MRYRSLSMKFSKLTTSLLSTPLSYCKGEPMNSLARLRASGRISCRTYLGLSNSHGFRKKLVNAPAVLTNGRHSERRT